MHRAGRCRTMVIALAILVVNFTARVCAGEPLQPGNDGWYTWRSDAVIQNAERCCFRWTSAGPRRRACDLDRDRGNYGSVKGLKARSGELQVYALIESGKPRRITVVSPHCEINTRETIVDLGEVAADTSVGWLRQYIAAESRLTSDVLLAISLHGGEQSLDVLINVVESHRDDEVRKEAVFWMVHSESRAAFDYIDGLLTGG